MNLALTANRMRPYWGATIIDGFEGMEGEGPLRGTPVASRVALASTDLVAADRIGVELMGIDPAWMGYLRYCADAGLGCFDRSRHRTAGRDEPRASCSHATSFTRASTSNSSGCRTSQRREGRRVGGPPREWDSLRVPHGRNSAKLSETLNGLETRPSVRGFGAFSVRRKDSRPPISRSKRGPKWPKLGQTCGRILFSGIAGFDRFR